MFEKIGRLAEAAASNVGVSRRGFLGRLGQSALGVVGVLAGLAATGVTARAGGGSYVCCKWRCYGYLIRKCYPAPFTCGVSGPPPYCSSGFGNQTPPILKSQTTVSHCRSCMR
jgi:hypothetical protein